MMKLDSRFLHSEIISTYQKISHTYNFSAVSCWVTTKALYTASAKYKPQNFFYGCLLGPDLIPNLE